MFVCRSLGNRMKILSVFGTRPEAIKMAPVITALEQNSFFQSIVCTTGQHRTMLDGVLNLFSISPLYDLNIMMKGQDLTHITTSVLKGLVDVLKEVQPDRVLVHGDTTTTLAASLASFYAHIPVGHVEAGLRTGNKLSPWPEEMNRRLADNVCDILFAPTNSAKDNLLMEGVPENRIFVTGNTVIDSLIQISELLESKPDIANEANKQLPTLDNEKNLIVVTGHRRENFGTGLEKICDSISELSKRRDVEIVYPLHLNPNVRDFVKKRLKTLKNVYLIDPLEYLSFVYLMKKARMILTDSGGIQEEAPSLGVPVLVMREETERPEAVSAGTVKLVGTNSEKIYGECCNLLDDESAFLAMSKAHNPYGDGKASSRIVKELMNVK